MCRASTLTHQPSLVVRIVELNDQTNLSRNEFALSTVIFWAVISHIPFNIMRWIGMEQSLLPPSYGINCSEFETRWGPWFFAPVHKGCGFNLYNGYRVFPDGKAAGKWCWPTTPANVEVKGRVELYLYSIARPSLQGIRWISPLTCDTICHIGGKIHGSYKTTAILHLVDKLAISLFIFSNKSTN